MQFQQLPCFLQGYWPLDTPGHRPPSVRLSMEGSKEVTSDCLDAARPLIIRTEPDIFSTYLLYRHPLRRVYNNAILHFGLA